MYRKPDMEMNVKLLPLHYIWASVDYEDTVHLHFDVRISLAGHAPWVTQFNAFIFLRFLFFLIKTTGGHVMCHSQRTPDLYGGERVSGYVKGRYGELHPCTLCRPGEKVRT